MILSENKRVYIASMFICLTGIHCSGSVLCLAVVHHIGLGDWGHKQEKVISLPRTNQSRSPLRANWMHFEMRHHYHAVTFRIRTESPIVVFMCAKRKKTKKDREKSFSQGGEAELDDE